MNRKQRLELFQLNRYVLTDKILPLVKHDDLRMKVEYCFKTHNIEFYPNLMPIGLGYEKWEREAKEEIDRIEKEHSIKLFKELLL